MSNPSRRTAVWLAAGLLLCPRAARAGAFALYEHGARSMGFAGAYVAQASDASAIFFNPAGVAFLKGKHLQIGGTLIAPASKFTGANPFPGAGVTEKDAVDFIVPPAFDYTHQISERAVLGVGVHVPFGLRTEWKNPETFTGRFISKRAELQGFSINPTLAYRLADRLAVAAGVDVRLSKISLDRNLSSFNPFTQKVVDIAGLRLESNRKTGIGFDVGLLAKPSDALSIGASYRHQVKIDYDGTAIFTQLPTGNSQLDALVTRSLPAGRTPVETSITYPALASGGIAYQWGDWTIEGDVNWYRWSVFERLVITFPDNPSLAGTVDAIEENYEDSFQYRFGLERRLSDRWAVRGGYFYDQSPLPVASVGPLLPDSDRHGIAAGFSWTHGRLSFDVANWYVFFRERSTRGLNRDSYEGTYKSTAELFSVSLRYGF